MNQTITSTIVALATFVSLQSLAQNDVQQQAVVQTRGGGNQANVTNTVSFSNTNVYNGNVLTNVQNNSNPTYVQVNYNGPAVVNNRSRGNSNANLNESNDNNNTTGTFFNNIANAQANAEPAVVQTNKQRSNRSNANSNPVVQEQTLQVQSNPQQSDRNWGNRTQQVVVNDDVPQVQVQQETQVQTRGNRGNRVQVQEQNTAQRQAVETNRESATRTRAERTTKPQAEPAATNAWADRMSSRGSSASGGSSNALKSASSRRKAHYSQSGRVKKKNRSSKGSRYQASRSGAPKCFRF